MWEKIKNLKKSISLKAKNANGEISDPINIDGSNVIKTVLDPEADLCNFGNNNTSEKTLVQTEFCYQYSKVNASLLHDKLTSNGKFLGENSTRTSKTPYNIDESEIQFISQNDKDRFILIRDFKLYHLYSFWSYKTIKQNIYFTGLRKYLENTSWNEAFPGLEDLKEEYINLNAYSFVGAQYIDSSTPDYFLILRVFSEQ